MPRQNVKALNLSKTRRIISADEIWAVLLALEVCVFVGISIHKMIGL